MSWDVIYWFALAWLELQPIPSWHARIDKNDINGSGSVEQSL